MKLGFGKKKIISPTAMPRKAEEDTVLHWFPGSRDEKRWLLKLRLDVMTPSERQEVERYVKKHAPNKKVGYLLWLVTGIVGGHRYYLHSYVSGIAILVLLVVSAFLGMTWASAAWWLIEGIRMATFLDDRTRKITEQGAALIEARHQELADSLRENKDAQTNKENLDLPIEVWFPQADGFTLQRSETAFMRTFYILLQEKKISPNAITVRRGEDGALLFAYKNKELGQLNLQQKRHTMSVPYEGQFSVITGELPEFLKYQSVWLQEIQKQK